MHNPDPALEQADRHIARAHALIARQESLMEELERDGHDVANARSLLETLQESLHQMEQHRRLIAARVRDGDGH